MTLSAVAVAVWAMGVALSHGVVEGLTGFGQLLVGIAALIAALAGLRNMRSLGHVKTTAAEVAVRADEAATRADDAAAAAAVASATSAGVAEAIGPANGTTVLDLLHEIKGFEGYQHDRNHKVLGELTELKLGHSIVIELAERLLSKLNEEGR